jgi:two-component system NtrC family sensor kinase
VIAIEYVRLFNETKEALERQIATAEILRVISSSPTDIQPVLDAVVRSATRLCEGYDAWIGLTEGGNLRVRAHQGPIAVAEELRPIRRGRVSETAVLDRRTIHVHDLAASGAEFPQGQADALRIGHRTTLGVPLLREGQAIGVILIRRLEVRPFTDKQIELLQTFADQAVIAIENVRLFTELQATNRELTTALDQQTATSEVLRTIAQAQTDVQPVFDTIVRSAALWRSSRRRFAIRRRSDALGRAAWVPTRVAGAASTAFPMPTQPGPHRWKGHHRAPHCPYSRPRE